MKFEIITLLICLSLCQTAYSLVILTFPLKQRFEERNSGRILRMLTILVLSLLTFFQVRPFQFQRSTQFFPPSNAEAFSISCGIVLHATRSTFAGAVRSRAGNYFHNKAVHWLSLRFVRAFSARLFSSVPNTQAVPFAVRSVPFVLSHFTA